MRWLRKPPPEVRVEFVERPPVPIARTHLRYVAGYSFRVVSGESDAEFLRALAAYLDGCENAPVLLGLWSMGEDGCGDWSYQVILEEASK